MSKLLLDLDRTLFDTDLFIRTLWTWIGQAYGVDIQAARANQGTYYRYVGDMYDYDFFRHIQDLGIDKQDLITRVHQELKQSHFLYPDVAAFLELTHDLDRAILTFGNEPYQSFKLSFCPQLLELPVYMTLEQKPGYIQAHWPDIATTLIDDRLLAGSLPSTTTFIQLNREQELPMIEHDSYRAVNTLELVRKEWL